MKTQKKILTAFTTCLLATTLTNAQDTNTLQWGTITTSKPNGVVYSKWLSVDFEIITTDDIVTINTSNNGILQDQVLLFNGYGSLNYELTPGTNAISFWGTTETNSTVVTNFLFFYQVKDPQIYTNQRNDGDTYTPTLNNIITILSETPCEMWLNINGITTKQQTDETTTSSGIANYKITNNLALGTNIVTWWIKATDGRYISTNTATYNLLAPNLLGSYWRGGETSADTTNGATHLLQIEQIDAPTPFKFLYQIDNNPPQVTVMLTNFYPDEEYHQYYPTLPDFTVPIGTHTVKAWIETMTDIASQVITTNITVRPPWINTQTNQITGTWNNLAISADAQKIIASIYSKDYQTYTINTNSLWRSIDGGTTWTDNHPTEFGVIQKITMSKDATKILLLAEDPTNKHTTSIYLSTNFGNSWNTLANPTTSTEYNNNPPYECNISGDGTTLLILAHPSTLYTSTNNGNTWKATSYPISKEGYDYAISTLSENGQNWIIASGDTNIIYSTNQGDIWNTLGNNTIQTYDAITCSWDAKTIIIAQPQYGNGREAINISTNNGNSWI